MSGINKVIILGRLGQDPEIRYTQKGSAVVTMSVATSEEWIDKSNNQKREKTEWHRVIVWGKLGELCNQYLSKGRQAFIEGRIQTRLWEDSEGRKRYSTEIIANEVRFLGGNKGETRPESQEEYEGSDIPF